MNSDEIWKDIGGYEGHYQVSNHGRIRSLNRITSDGKRIVGRVIRLRKDSKKRYMLVSLNKDGVRATCLVHRIVAKTFIPNIDNLPCVNHKDETQDNNRVANLEWCTHKYNSNYGTSKDKVRAAAIEQRARAILVIFPDDKVKWFDSKRDACRKLNLNNGNVGRCLRGINNTHLGLKFKYA